VEMPENRHTTAQPFVKLVSIPSNVGGVGLRLT
jgi:hypothetical protein